MTHTEGDAWKTYDYDAYGVEKAPEADDTNPFRYCGEYYDSESGMIYLRNRYYDPEIGRFITEDPARDGMNWYAYCEGNPVNRVDPSGMTGYSASLIASYPDFKYIQDMYGKSTAEQALHYAMLALSMAETYASNEGLDSTWNNEADAYRHFMWNAMLSRHVGYEEAKFIANIHEKISMQNNDWIDNTVRFEPVYDAGWIYGKMNQETFMDLWNNQVGRELANNRVFHNMNGNELFDMAKDNNWVITDVNSVFSYLGISDCIADYEEYTVNVAWKWSSGNIIVYDQEGKPYVTLKIGV